MLTVRFSSYFNLNSLVPSHFIFSAFVHGCNAKFHDMFHCFKWTLVCDVRCLDTSCTAFIYLVWTMLQVSQPLSCISFVFQVAELDCLHCSPILGLVLQVSFLFSFFYPKLINRICNKNGCVNCMHPLSVSVYHCIGPTSSSS
jgi:hypothetical protein